MMRRPSAPGHALAWSALAAAALLTGCVNLAPDYERPALPVPPALDNTATSVTPAGDEMPRQDWRTFVLAPPLRELIALALDNNRDLRVALLSIDKARAQYGVERANRLPSVAATGAGNRSRSAADQTASGRSQDSSQYSAQLGFSSYEIDFFGRVRNLNEVALQEYLRISENQRSVQLSLIAELANAWLTLAADQQRLQLARDTLKSREASYALTQRIHGLGATSGLVLAQNRTTVDSARVDVASFASQVARDRNALQALVGAPVPASLLPPAAVPSPGAIALISVPADLPSSVLLQRPDVEAAERSLRGSYASIGAARAAFFPSITLTASVGSASNALSDLFEAGNGTWSFLPQIRLPIFDAGRNRANLQVSQANQGIAVAQYEKTVQTAFREVSDALADRATLVDRLDAQASLLDATQRAFTLSDARFRAGVDNYLTVLDAQRSLYLAQQTQISLQLAEQVNRITLYKVLGGG